MDELDMGEYTQLEHNSAEKHGAGDFIYDLIACVCHEGSKTKTNNCKDNGRIN